MKYIPTIPKPDLTSTNTSVGDYSAIKDEEYKGEDNYINYSYTIPINVNEINYNNITLSPPTDNDYTNGYYVRYFLKKRNDNIFIEITQDIYNSPGILFDNLLYDKFEFNWKITGNLHDKIINGMTIDYGVIDTNKRTVDMINTTLKYDLSKMIKNFSQYAK